MKNKCNIIKDILPLYAEDIVSEDTREFVKEHLSDCSQCNAEYERIKKPARFIADTDTVPLKSLKRKLFVKRIETAVFTAALMLTVFFSVLSVLTVPDYFPYSKNLISVTENGNSTVTVSFDKRVTGYTVQKETGENSKIKTYRVTAWSTPWDVHLTKREAQNMIIPSKEAIALFYSPNDGTEDVFVYGTNPYKDGGTISLPRLVLGYYLVFAIFAALIFGVLLFALRKKETLRKWMEHLFLIPVSYILAHLCIKGFSIYSYSTPRNFGAIVITAFLIYCVLMIGVDLYRKKKAIADLK